MKYHRGTAASRWAIHEKGVIFQLYPRTTSVIAVDRPTAPYDAKKFFLVVTIILVLTLLGLIPLAFVPDRFAYADGWGIVFATELMIFTQSWAKQTGKITPKHAEIVRAVGYFLIVGAAVLVGVIWH
jgi:hypothetical protein